ncbi:uncharacterized protein LOC131947112 isoform X2 [Physella acuta]|nr:uncharacterized protein LOC131947112 isoform X2 [Physella acuta]XP_059164198.1 uncharacterized protein LOC131947112 isoform X2 [Physella acuta]
MAQGDFTSIDFLSSFNTSDVIETQREITKRHWKPAEDRTKCFEVSCQKVFTLLERHHHCRSCGEVFCAECVKYQRRLNALAHADPVGQFYKVCRKCFEKGKITDGQTRSHSVYFHELRVYYKEHGMVHTGNSSEWRMRLNLDRECQRLLLGFNQSVGNSEVQRTLHGVKSFVTTPQWMKSSVWSRENLVKSCQYCKEVFGLLKKKAFCSVCGIVVCKSCSSNDLLVYIPDEDKGREASQPKMAVIKIIGCPKVEPELSIYLRVCSKCKDKLILKQVDQQEEDSLMNGPDFMDVLNKLHDKFVTVESHVRDQLPKYKEIVDSLADRSRRSSTHNNMKTLAKAQEDLSQMLAQHLTTVQYMKKLKPSTATQSKLFQVYIRAKCEFYLDHMSMFRTVKHKLSESASDESLKVIQRIMDKNAIISTHLYLHQLIYEMIYLCQRYELQESLIPVLMQIEQKVETDVQTCLQAEGDDVTEHMNLVQELTQERMKKNKLIRPSKTQLQRRGTKYVYELMSSRVENLLNQVKFQLQLATTLNSFQASKKALETGLAEMKKKREEDIKETNDFFFVQKDDFS